MGNGGVTSNLDNLVTALQCLVKVEEAEVTSQCCLLAHQFSLGLCT